MRHNPLSLFAGLLLAACGASQSSVDDRGSDAMSDRLDQTDAPDKHNDATGDSDTTDVCRDQHDGQTADGDPATICDAFFTDRPFVRPPEDRRDTGSTALYVGFYYGVNFDEARVVDRKGTEYVLLDQEGAAVRHDASAADKLPAKMHMPSNRHFYTIYRITGEVGSYTNPVTNETSPSFRIQAGDPAIVISGNAIDSILLGTWEGSVSRRVSAGTWSRTDLVPIRIAFTELAPLPNFSTWGPDTAPLADGKRFEVRGAVVNANHGATSAEGECLPALSSYGEANPLFGSQAMDLKLLRMSTMHQEGDYQLVISYPDDTPLGKGMGAISLVHPTTLIQSAVTMSWGAGSHNAFTFTLSDLKPVSGGGGACGQ